MRARALSFVVASIMFLSGVFVGASATTTPAGAAAVPRCTFNGFGLPLITGMKPGSTITLKCSGLTASHPYLLAEASLLIGIDPAAKALLSGSSGLSPALFTAALAALPELNAASITTPFSDSSGNLNTDWTVPTSQPLDPNATCPPSRVQYNAGLVGCALAMIDLTTQKPVGAGSAVFEYVGFNLLPPAPTVKLSAKQAAVGTSVTVSELPGHTSYWWVSTLAALNNLLTGGTSLPTVKVTMGSAKKPTTLVANVSVVPATYTQPTFTPPRLQGTFKVPALRGSKPVTVTQSQTLLGLPLTNTATSRLRIAK